MLPGVGDDRGILGLISAEGTVEPHDADDLGGPHRIQRDLREAMATVKLGDEGERSSSSAGLSPKER